MTKTIRAKFRDGKLEPLEPVDLPEGQELEVILTEKPEKRPLEESLGVWTDDMIDVDAFLKEIYEQREAGSRSDIPFNDPD